MFPFASSTVTVIATGFGPQRRRRATPARDRESRTRPQAGVGEGRLEGFDVPADVLEVPSFLRDS